MPYRPSEFTRTVATELAGLIYAGSKENEKMQGLLSQLQQPAPRLPVEPAPEEKSTANGIGIWREVSENDARVYRRDDAKSGEWHLWADVEAIQPKQNRKRILLLGESAARGFLYDPFYNVAKELEAVVNKTTLLKGAEVIDLARTSMLLDGLQDIIRSAHLLSPDAVVIFAGNNWIFNAFGEVDRDIWQKPGNSAPSSTVQKAMVEERLTLLVTGLLEDIKTHFTDRNIPVVFVVPEFNLQDWKSSAAETLQPWLPGNGWAQWREQKKLAAKALADHNDALLQESADHMIRLDPSNPLGHEFMAAFHLRRQENDKAAACLRVARDTIVYMRSAGSMPRCITAIREQLLTAGPLYGMHMVDLQEVFGEIYPDQLPDRQLFLDNCHLTATGIMHAMRHTAQVLLQIFAGGAYPLEEVPFSGMKPDNNICAIAHFSAAIYNAHSGQPAEIIQYHCHQALGLSRRVQKGMLHYIDFASRYAYTLFCKSFEDIIRDGSMRQYEGGILLCPPRGKKLMDITLVNAIVQSLETAGVPAADTIRQLRIAEHAISEKKCDLLQSYYASTSYHTFFIGRENHCYESRQAESSFQFVSAGSTDLDFELCFRTPFADTSSLSEIRLYLNGDSSPLVTFGASEKWCNVFFTVSRERLLTGVNEIIVAWPDVSLYQPQGSYHSLPAFVTALYPVAGEIFSFTAVGPQPGTQEALTTSMALDEEMLR
ncbi:MAG: hypothetical protein J7623_15055 [Chitinophaga sp.]|uniref:hypothetical protein n=1 Tax=Chitinophaga sp. TaxID=1869181 RepID=UPI001B1DAE45|nr:hypothetical protein [Chitinophaga sp.]MBO9729953.1 hypothetical protein [Chitinophaga sp.]